MTRLVTSGFEVYVAGLQASGDTTALREAGAPDGYYSIAGAYTRITSDKHGGFACAESVVNINTQLTFTTGTLALDRDYWLRIYLKLLALPVGIVNLIRLSTGTQVTARIDTLGRVLLAENSTTSASINDGNWHRVEIYNRSSVTQANRAYELRVDGTTVSSGTGQGSSGGAPADMIIGGTADTTLQWRIDDIALNDGQGTSHNTWPGDGYVICLLPTADNTRGTWTGGAGGTTNLFDALNNTPPVGAVAPGTNASQISANAVATTGKFDTQSYTAAGATTGDTAIGCSVVACTGEQVATGTKSGSVSTDTAVNNTPSSTTASLAYGLDIGAEAAWPQFWRWWASPFTPYATQPTLTSGARLNIITTTTSRVADACFLGLYVEMQPAAAKSIVFEPRRIARNSLLRR